ncbi:MAG: hypothetical protein JO138_07285 [Acidobacteriaceae bacterium]|nr:hypothetical protein [Acidobacteriota bacterium]MBV9499160.1 hypothetical protein [Acidobacteriaceae bacterium]
MPFSRTKQRTQTELKSEVTLEPANDERWAVLLTVERRAGWLLDLAGVEFDKIDAVEKARLRGELAGLLEIYRAGPLAREHVSTLPFPDPLREPFCPVSEKALIAFSKWLREGTEALLQGKPWRVQMAVEYSISVSPEGGIWSYELDPGADVQMVLRRAAIETLRDAKKEARRCAECGRLFLRRRSQMYCSPYCGHLQRTRRWVENKRQPEIPPKRATSG